MGSFTVQAGAELTMCGPDWTTGDDPTNDMLGLISTASSVEFRYIPTPGFEAAIPPAVQDLIDNNHIGVWGTIYHQVSIPNVRTTTIVSETDCSVDGGAGAFWTGSSGFHFYDVVSESTTCQLLTDGVFKAGAPPGGAFKVCSYVDAGLTQEVVNGSLRFILFTKQSEDGSAMIIVPVEGEVDA